MKFTSLGMPQYNEELGLYECEINENGGEPYKICANSLSELQEKKKQFIIENLELAKEELINWPSLNK